ncbi:uncharacterized protein MELLADRAFT_114309 [Melampsora larici-populina 98AG31]|uniref:Uncharacterized protein n=1 Tax=Melampsora larici-populina (strain 98AG31 / pathotype 3-4-7) TaxID=747676 RepID=F4SCZ8_MELLP|nr:uncharacterized protein MELLADRAFT_114309 [Melampsora larici-populina 98AG31]EGF97480.1 hypothetical protein MELLADRAFT_114309 [Melampsora larici-populina 98AG31]
MLMTAMNIIASSRILGHPENDDGHSSAQLEPNTVLKSPNEAHITPEVPINNELNNHYRDFINDRFSSPPPTPDDPNDGFPANRSAPNRIPTPSESTSAVRQAHKKPTKKRVSRVPLTAEERALDDSDHNDSNEDEPNHPVAPRCMTAPSQATASPESSNKIFYVWSIAQNGTSMKANFTN